MMLLFHNHSETFSSPANQTVVKKVVENAQSLLPNSSCAALKGESRAFCAPLIYVCSCTEAARTYYNSAAGTERLKMSGKYTLKCVQQRRRKRLKRVYNIYVI